ncbi:MAG: AIM24 family protein, partial [Candidatus Poseidoniaceae archaeon]|nr:AIM24 family protein [Candidatus Poseidoniaceae archaeon]
EDTVQYTINKVGGMKSFLVGGEGLVMNFTGQGNIWIQTRNVGSLASNLIPFLPKSGSGVSLL